MLASLAKFFYFAYVGSYLFVCKFFLVGITAYGGSKISCTISPVLGRGVGILIIHHRLVSYAILGFLS